MTARRQIISVLVLIFSSAACTQILDIQDARVDTSLSAAAGAKGGSDASGGSDTSGGSAGIAGSGAQNRGGSTVGGADHGGAANQSGGGKAGSASSEAGATMSLAGASGEPSPCESYCAAMVHNCAGAYEQYHSNDQCLAVCKQLPKGSQGDENVDTVECRLRQANFAESEPAVYCKSAGPLGAGKCGTNCESYCELMAGTCTAESTAGNLEPSYFSSSADCMSACTGLPPDPGGPVQYSSSPTAVPSSYIGNNVYCRTYHVAAALEQDAPTEHCPHAMGGDPCNAQ